MNLIRAVKVAALGASLALGGLLVSAAWAEAPGAARDVEIVVEKGYHPSTVTVTAGEQARVKFIRREYTGCTREVVFPTLGIRRELPTGQPVVIELPAMGVGEVPFHCGMKMIRGTLKVEAAR